MLVLFYLKAHVGHSYVCARTARWWYSTSLGSHKKHTSHTLLHVHIHFSSPFPQWLFPVKCGVALFIQYKEIWCSGFTTQTPVPYWETTREGILFWKYGPVQKTKNIRKSYLLRVSQQHLVVRALIQRLLVVLSRLHCLDRYSNEPEAEWTYFYLDFHVAQKLCFQHLLATSTSTCDTATNLQSTDAMPSLSVLVATVFASCSYPQTKSYWTNHHLLLDNNRIQHNTLTLSRTYLKASELNCTMDSIPEEKSSSRWSFIPTRSYPGVKQCTISDTPPTPNCKIVQIQVKLQLSK